MFEKIVLSLFLILGVLILNANADILTLKSGKVVEGKIIGEKGNSYTVEIDGGTVSYNKTQVESIIRGEPSEEQAKEIERKQEAQDRVKYKDRWLSRDEYRSWVMQERQTQRLIEEEEKKTRDMQERDRLLVERAKRPEPISLLKIGMTKKEVIECMGHPYDINKTTNSHGVREQWVYGSGNSAYLYIENGILTSWQD